MDDADRATKLTQKGDHSLINKSRHPSLVPSVLSYSRHKVIVCTTVSTLKSRTSLKISHTGIPQGTSRVSYVWLSGPFSSHESEWTMYRQHNHTCGRVFPRSDFLSRKYKETPKKRKNRKQEGTKIGTRRKGEGYRDSSHRIHVRLRCRMLLSQVNPHHGTRNVPNITSSEQSLTRVTR